MFYFTPHFTHTQNKVSLAQNFYSNLQPVTAYKIVTFLNLHYFLLFHWYFFFIFSYLSLSFKIITNSSWLISMSVSAWDTKVSMLLSLLLTNIRILSYFCFCFFLWLVIFLLFLLLKETFLVNDHGRLYYRFFTNFEHAHAHNVMPLCFIWI